MTISLHERTEAHVRTYFERTQNAEIQHMLPSSAETAEEALAMFRRAQQPGADSFGRTIYADGQYVGDVWCYCIQQEEPNAMLSYCIFDKAYWKQGIATEAIRLFIAEVHDRYGVHSIGAFTYADNTASSRVLDKNGFCCMEQFEEEGRLSAYWKLSL